MKRSLAHTVWECKYHIVWVPKNRRKIIYGKLRKEIGFILRRLCQYKEIKVLEGSPFKVVLLSFSTCNKFSS